MYVLPHRIEKLEIYKYQQIYAIKAFNHSSNQNTYTMQKWNFRNL